MIDTVIIIPCHNEARRLRTADMLAFVARNPRIRLLLVNDGSTDATLNMLLTMKDINAAQCDVLDLPGNVGKAEAVRQAMHAELETKSRSACKYIGFWDADLATPLEAACSFARVLDHNREIQIVIGSRLALCGHDIQRSTKRKFLSSLFSRLATAILGIKIRDTQCGAKLFRLTPTLKSIFETPFTSKWVFDLEIFLRQRVLWKTQVTAASTAHLNLRNAVWEYPLEMWRDVPGSKLTQRAMFRAAVDLAKVFVKYRMVGSAISNKRKRAAQYAELPRLVVEPAIDSTIVGGNQGFHSPAPWGSEPPKSGEEGVLTIRRKSRGQPIVNTPELPIVSSLWIGPISPLELICMESFIRHGHRYELYQYGPLPNLPAGVTVRDAREICPEREVFQNKVGSGAGSYACFADLFRYQLLYQRGGFWVDTDVFCVRPFAFDQPYVFGAEDKPVANGIIKAPAKSELMRRVCAEAHALDHSAIVWNELGDILTKHVIALGLLKYVQPAEVFSPIPYYEIPNVVKSNRAVHVKAATHGIHLYQEVWRRKGLDKHDLAKPYSLLAELRDRNQAVARPSRADSGSLRAA